MIGWTSAADEDRRPGLPPLAADRRSSVARTLRELAVLLLAATTITFLLKTFVAQAFYIPSGSMLPQLQLNDRVVVSKIAYVLHEPRRGDIVVFDAPSGSVVGLPESRSAIGSALRFLAERVGFVQPSTDEFIKRVVGLPGETVEARGGSVYVGGRRLVEPYLPPGVRTDDFAPTRVPAGRLFVMGDNRSNSSDSRFFGPIRRDTVVGRTVLRVWPLTRASFL